MGEFFQFLRKLDEGGFMGGNMGYDYARELGIDLPTPKPKFPPNEMMDAKYWLDRTYMERFAKYADGAELFKKAMVNWQPPRPNEFWGG